MKHAPLLLALLGLGLLISGGVGLFVERISSDDGAVTIAGSILLAAAHIGRRS